jgi:hypothetical protein
MQTIKLVRAFNDNRFNVTNQQHPTTSPVQHPKPGKLAVLIGLPEQVKELLGHEDLDDHDHGPDVEMPHVYQEREARHHPQRGVGPDEHRLVFVPVVRQQVCAIVLVHIRMDLNITINNNEGSMLHDFSRPVTKNPRHFYTWRYKNDLAGAFPVPQAAAVRGTRGARRRVAGAVVPMHLLDPGAIRPDKSWGFFDQRNKKKRRSIQVRTCGSVEIHFEPVQCKWRAGYTKNAGGASRGDETRA